MGMGRLSQNASIAMYVILGLMGELCDNQGCLSQQEERKTTKEVKMTQSKRIWVPWNDF